MKILFLVALTFLSPASFAAPVDSTEAGITLGSPYGLSGRTWFAPENSMDYGFGWDLLNSSKFQIYADYLMNRPDTFQINDAMLDFFYGAGLVLRSHSGPNEDTAVFGPRFPVGVSYYFAHPDLEVFGELALDVGLVPHTDVFFDVVVGARFTLF